MAQSQNRQRKRAFKQLFNNSQQSKISNRYLSKFEEYKKLTFDELDQYAKDVYNKTIKISKTDKQALYDVYRPLVFQRAMEKAKEINNQAEEPKTESNG